MGENEDPINKINLSLKQLLVDLKGNNSLINNYMETLIFKDKKDESKLYDYNLKKFSSSIINNNNKNFDNFLIEERDNISQEIPIGEYLTKKISKKKKSNVRMNKINHNYKPTKKRNKILSERSLSNYNKDFNKEKRLSYKIISYRKNNDHQVNKESNLNKYKSILEKIKQMRNVNENNKKEILEYQNNCNKILQTIIENISKKEKGINERHEEKINSMIDEINTYKNKINELIINNKKNMKLNIQKIQKITNQNKIQKEQIKIKYELIIKELQEDKNNLIKDKNIYIFRFEELEEAKMKLNKEIISLIKEKEQLNQENEKLKEQINQLNRDMENINKNNKEQVEKLNIEYENKIKILSEEIDQLKNEIKDKTNELNESKKEIRKFQNLMKDVKITLKENEKNKSTINEFEKELKQYKKVNSEIISKNKLLNDENENIIREIKISKMEKNQLNKEMSLKKELLEQYKKNINDLSKENEELIHNIQKLNKEIKELKNKNDKIIQINNGIKVENVHKLKETIQSIKKEKMKLEEKYKDLLKRFELKEKTNKINNHLLGRNKSAKFENNEYNINDDLKDKIIRKDKMLIKSVITNNE